MMTTIKETILHHSSAPPPLISLVLLTAPWSVCFNLVQYSTIPEFLVMTVSPHYQSLETLSGKIGERTAPLHPGTKFDKVLQESFGII